MSSLCYLMKQVFESINKAQIYKTAIRPIMTYSQKEDQINQKQKTLGNHRDENTPLDLRENIDTLKKKRNHQMNN